jgi:hypothetical protein
MCESCVHTARAGAVTTCIEEKFHTLDITYMDCLIANGYVLERIEIF